MDNYSNEGFENGISIHDGFPNINWGIDKSQMIISEKDKSYPLLINGKNNEFISYRIWWSVR